MKNNDTEDLIKKLHQGDWRALARCISIVENASPGYDKILESLTENKSTGVIGITGPPGAGKSTLVNSLIGEILKKSPGKKISVLAVDPTSPFTNGSLLGDRLRMTDHFNNSNVFIRSIATRGVMGGLSAKAIEISDVMKAAGFDYIIVETVGVGQSELEIASLADTTIVVFVPESGDEIQTIKSGIMEIAEIFVVNKSDRSGADALIKNIKTTLHERAGSSWEIPVIKTTASANEGIEELFTVIEKHLVHQPSPENKNKMLLDKAIKLANGMLIRKIDPVDLENKLSEASRKPQFNMYSFIKGYLQLK